MSHFDCGRLLGIFGYDRHRVEPTVKQALVDALCAPEADNDPRLPALARLLVKARLHQRHQLGSDQRARIHKLAAQAEQTPAPHAAIRAIDAAAGYTVYAIITGR